MQYKKTPPKESKNIGVVHHLLVIPFQISYKHMV
jgi:hypothetical protein